VLEPWHVDSVGLENRLESTLQSIRGSRQHPDGCRRDAIWPWSRPSSPGSSRSTLRADVRVLTSACFACHQRTLRDAPGLKGAPLACYIRSHVGMPSRLRPF
jgi:hypothetical protein